MEKRKSERVQFFQLSMDKDIKPVWVFGQTDPEATLGLLIDITPDGAQVITNKSQELVADDYRLIAYTSEAPDREVLTVNVRRCWSRLDGTLYIRNGLVFDEQISVQPLLVARDAGSRWLRCELLPLAGADGAEKV